MKTGKTLQELAVEIERQHATKKDYIASTSNMAVHTDEGGEDVHLEVGDKLQMGLNNIAHDQIAEHTGIPTKYYNRMRNDAPSLLANNINAWFAKYPAPRMVRVLDGNARAFLSDKYAPFDNYDFAGAMLPLLRKRNLNVMSCEITERRLYIKAVDEQLFRDVPVGYKMGDGSHRIFDTCAPAIICSNSEVGFGRLVVETGTYTSGCTNLALIAGGGMKRTHLGARNKMTENMDVVDLDAIMSQETKRKTMEALWLQVHDVIAAAFDENIVRKRMERIAATADNKITSNKFDKVMEVVAERFGLDETESASVFRNLIEGGNLTQYGLHAAVTRAAQDADTYDRATELEYMGGRIVELPANDWTRIAEAA